MIEFQRVEAVIFDMDGVLIDSEPLWKIAMEGVFKKVGCNLTRSDFQKTVGLRIDEVIEYWYSVVKWDNYSVKEVENMIVEEMVVLINKHPYPLPGVIDTLNYLKEKNYSIGLATSSYRVLIEAVLNALNIETYFQETRSAEDDKYGKPHPAVYLTVANKLNVNPTNCLVIEDSLNGIISGKSARMQVACIPEKTHSPEPKLSLADEQFDDMSKLLMKISTIND